MSKPVKPLNIIYLISSWLSVSMIFIIGEVVIQYGVYSTVVIVSAFIAAFFVSLPVQQYFSARFTNSKSKLRIERFILGLWLLESYMLHIFISGLILYMVAQINVYVSIYVTVVLFFGISFYMKKKETRRKRLNDTKFTLISGLAIVLPIYIYLQKGLESVYHNLLYYQPKVLHYQPKDLLVLFLVAFIIFITKFSLQGSIITKYKGINLKQGYSKLLVGIFIYSTFILSFATMNVVAITQNLNINHTNELFVLLIKKLSTPTIFIMFIIVLYCSTILTLVEVCYVYNIQNSESRSMITSYLLPLLAALLTILIYNKSSLLEIYLFFGIVMSILFILLCCINTIKYIFPIMSKKLKNFKQ